MRSPENNDGQSLCYGSQRGSSGGGGVVMVKGAGLSSAHFLCVWVSAQKGSLSGSHLKCTS